MANNNAFPPTKCWMVGFGPYCDVADVNTVGIQGQGAGSEGGDPGEGPGARDFYNCLRQEELACLKQLHGCIADEMLHYADAMSLKVSYGEDAERAWTEQAYNSGFYNWFDQQNTRYISRVNARSNLYGILGAPDYNSPNTAFIYHAAAKTACLARLKCNFARCYCQLSRCVRCEDDGRIVIPNPNTGNPGDDDPSAKTFRNNTITTDPFIATDSAYGQVIPLVYGVAKLKGSIIWAGNQNTRTLTFVTENDTEVLTETVDVRTIDLAVSVCAGEIGAIGRIWSGDRVIYNGAYRTGGAANNAKIDYDPQSIGLESKNANLDFPFKVTVYRGTEEQRPHNLTLETGQLPIAYRGQAYVVLENFAFIGAGEIPDFTFEVLQTIDTASPPVDVGNITGIPFASLENDVLIPDLENNSFATVGVATPPLGRSSIVKLDASTLVPHNVLRPDTDAIEGTTGYNVDPSAFTMSSDGVAFFNDLGSDNYKRTFIFNSGPERTRRAFGATQMTTPTGDYLRGLSAVYKNAFMTVTDVGRFPTRLGFFAADNILQMLRYDLDIRDYEVVKRTTFAGNIEAVYTHEARFEDEIRRYLYVFYWTGTGVTRAMTARVYLLQNTTDVDAYGFDPTALVYKEYPVGKFAWRGDDSVEIVGILPDLRDGRLVFLMKSPTSAYAFKWIDGAIVWTIQDDRLPRVVADMYPAYPTHNGAYRWLNGDGMYTLNLTNGAIDSANVGLSAPTIGAQYYDDRTDSVVFLDGGFIYRCYAERSLKATTRLADVLVDVLQRGGLNVPPGTYDHIDTLITGYVVTSQSSAKTILEQLAMLYGLTVVEDGVLKVTLNGDTLTPTVIATGDLGQRQDGGTVQIKLTDDYADYTKVVVQYYDVGQLGEINTVVFDAANIQPVEKVGAENALSYDFPAVLSESQALSFAERMMYRAIEVKARGLCILPPSSMLDAGDGVKIDGIHWRIRTTTYQTGLGKVVELVSDPLVVDRDVPVLPGTGVPVDDDGVVVPTGSVAAQIINVPSAYPAGAVGADRLSSSCIIALTQTPSAPVEIEYSDNLSGRTGTVTLSRAPVIGRATNVLAPIGGNAGIDRTSSLTVVFDTAPDQTRFNGDAFVGYNERLLIVGSELVKFNTVTWSVDGLMATFTDLLRGRRNTDMYASSHEVGEQVVLYETGATADAFIGTNTNIMGTTRQITLTDSSRSTRTWIGTLRSDVIIPPVLWRDDGFATLSTEKIVKLTAIKRYWNDSVFEDDAGDVIARDPNAHQTLSVRPSFGQLFIWLLRAPYNDADFRANFVPPTLVYEEYPTNPYIAACMLLGAQPGVTEMQALPRHFCYMATIGPYSINSGETPRGMVAYGTFGESSLYERELTEALETSPFTGGVMVNINGYARPF